jgi:uncharacterized protein YjbI with pentapeptide repeats
VIRDLASKVRRKSTGDQADCWRNCAGIALHGEVVEWLTLPARRDTGSNVPESSFNEHSNPPPRDPQSLLTTAGSFRGDPNHLAAFVRLVSTPVRHASRSEALHNWKAYNRVFTRDSRGRTMKSIKFRKIDLRGADLRNVCVGYVDFRSAQLDGADLRGVRMKGALFDHASLEGAKLDNAYFAFASFANAKLVKASARGVNFREAKLIGADFSGSDLTGALLADTQRRNWNLHGIRCEYVYWDDSERTTYAPGEFEKLFSEETMVTLESAEGITNQALSTLPMLIKALEMHPGAVVSLHNIEDSNGKFLVRLKIQNTGGLTKDDMRAVLNEFSSRLQNNITIKELTFHNEIQSVGQLFQADSIQINQTRSE